MIEAPVTLNEEEAQVLPPEVGNDGQVLGGLAVEGGGDGVAYLEPGVQDGQTVLGEVPGAAAPESEESDSGVQQGEGRWDKDKAAAIGWALHDDNEKVMGRLDGITEREPQVKDRSNLYEQLFDQNPDVFAAIPTGEFRDIVRGLEGSPSYAAMNRLSDMRQWADTTHGTLTWNAKGYRTLDQADVEVVLEEVSSLLDRMGREPDSQKLSFRMVRGVPLETGQALLQKLTETRQDIGTEEARYVISAKDTNAKLIELCDAYKSAVEEGLSNNRTAFQQELEQYSTFQSPEDLSAFWAKQKADEERRKAGRGAQTAPYEQSA